uniref:Nephronophthisis 4 n=1 Tax=Monopterus albus TaxID=43700 RepID=A0A3Q3J2N3_MONAL
MADSWREVFERNRLVPPPSQTVRLAVESHFTQSHGFQLILSRVTVSEEEPVLTYQLRVTLFDRNHQHYFGKTWKSSPQSMKINQISFNEVLYFHTSLCLPSTVVVLELVSLSPRQDGSQQALGRGFAVLELFTNRPEAQAAEGNRRLNLHHGSPRSLLHPLLLHKVTYQECVYLTGQHGIMLNDVLHL